MNLANLGLSGLMAAQNRLQTTGHNINNADTDGYNRQTVLTQTAGAVNRGSGFIGRGVQAVTVQRAYDNFLYRQLVSAQSGGASLVAYGNEIRQVDNLFADRTVGVSPALQQFFDGLQAVASSPADPAARQELLGRSASLVSQLNDANQFLDEQRTNINTQISTVVTQVNSYVERIQDLNRQITVARASAAHEPNDLLDQRDQLFTELNQLVTVKNSEQDGQFNLTLGNGQVLLGGNTVYPLQAVPSSDDPSRLVVAYSAPAADGQSVAIQMPEHRVQGGTLGGLLQYRRDALDPVQNELGRLAVGLAMSVNAAHRDGYDLNGNTQIDFFRLGNIPVVSATANAGDALGVQFADASALTGQDYRIEFDGTDFIASRLPEGTTVNLGPANAAGVVVDGLEITLPANAAAGDSWLIKPTRAAAGDLELAISDPARIAAAGEDPDHPGQGAGSADNENALRLAGLQTEKVLGGHTMNLNEAFSRIVNKVGVLTQQNSTAAKAQASLIQQNYAAQQAVSGVNLDEEYVHLDRYQEQFRAASRLIDVSSTLFDTLLGLRS